MKITLYLVAVLVLALALSLSSIAIATGGDSAEERSQDLSTGQRFLVLFSGNVRGELEPCG
jgi:hypothetical protein